MTRSGQNAVEPADDLIGRAVTPLAEDVDTAGHLDQGGDLPAEEAQVVPGLESQPVDLVAAPPLLQADDQIDLGLPGQRARPEDGPDVDDAEAADLHEVAAEGRG